MALTDLRGKETRELQEEIDYVANATGLTPKEVQILNWLYELGTIMVPVENITRRIEGTVWAGAGVGIIARDNKGDVYQARSLDLLAKASSMEKLQYIGKFTKNG